MMCTHIPYICHSMEPRNHNSVSNTKVLSNLTLASATIEIAVQNRHRAKRRNLKHYPTWREVIGIFGLECLDKLLITPTKFPIMFDIVFANFAGLANNVVS